MVRGAASSNGIYVSVAQTWTTQVGTITVTANMPTDLVVDDPAEEEDYE